MYPCYIIIIIQPFVYIVEHPMLHMDVNISPLFYNLYFSSQPFKIQSFGKSLPPVIRKEFLVP